MSFCSYFDAKFCHSCGWIDYHYAEQLKLKNDHLHTLLDSYKPQEWLKPATSQLKGFRNKAKMVASPSWDGVVLGIAEDVSLIECPLYSTSMQKALHIIQEWLRELGVKGYDVRLRKGELKYVLLTRSQSSGGMMLRFVLRSHGIIGRLKNALEDLMEKLPDLQVVSVNIQPVHMAILEGEEEIFLTEQQRLEERLNNVPLFIRPKSFFQTNPEVAEKLYRIASEWANESSPKILWDLFCGVGGFALHCAAPDRRIVGIEIESEAIECARASASQLKIENITFESLDAATFSATAGENPDLIIVNPPRRGLGEQICKWLGRIGADRVLYSSCNAVSLAKDLEMLSGYGINRVQLFDMFPHTSHYEVLVELVRE